MTIKKGDGRIARFSSCERYRYTLTITWDTTLQTCHFLMLNPSTADEVKNDPTVERAERYARSWGYGALLVTNIFAWRATDPKAMKAQDDPVGPENDNAIVEAAETTALTVCAWGNHGSHMGRSQHVLDLLAKSGTPLHCLTVTGAGEPGHPLYLRKDLQPIPLPSP
ncbi:MAG: DUF1643 domain-containing protein [Magnetococcales bacterium]|nr:DUF1643 domain-containing protein [Magnetococcales bacterium]